MKCQSCGASETHGSLCSATESLICQGHAPIAGCGKVLTPDERHWYGSCCEGCELAWGDAIDEWRGGGENKDLDAMFDLPRAFQ